MRARKKYRNISNKNNRQFIHYRNGFRYKIMPELNGKFGLLIVSRLMHHRFGARYMAIATGYPSLKIIKRLAKALIDAFVRKKVNAVIPVIRVDYDEILLMMIAAKAQREAENNAL